MNVKVIQGDPRIKTTVHHDREVCPGGLQPFLYVTKKGTLLLQYQTPEKPLGTRPLNYPYATATYLSRDGGASFEKINIYQDPAKDDPFLEAGALELSDGTFFLMDTYVTPDPEERKEHGVGEIWTSEDDLYTWKGPEVSKFYLPRINYYASSDDDGNASVGARLHRTTLQLPNGDLLAVMYAWFDEDCAPASYEPRMMKTRVFVVKSCDLGKTWETLSTVAVDAGIGTEGFGEPVMVRVERGPHEGRIICVMRTGRDLYTAYSDNDGQDWSDFKSLALPGIDVFRSREWKAQFEGKYNHIDPHRRSLSGAIVDPDLTQMKNGALVLSFGVRLPAQLNWQDPTVPGNGVYAAFSLDGGDTWSHVIQLMGGRLTTHYTAVREYGENKLLFAYDVGSWREGGRGGRVCNIDVELQ